MDKNISVVTKSLFVILKPYVSLFFYFYKNFYRFKILSVALFLFTPTSGQAAEHRELSDLERLLQTKKVFNGNFKNQDLRAVPLVGCQLKGSDFTSANIGDLDLTGADFYNCSFKGAKIHNWQQLWTLYPTFNVPGRIHSIMDAGSSIDLRTLNLSHMDGYKRRAEQQNDRVGIFVLAYLYETYGTREQEEEASSLYFKSAKMGMIEAYNNLGWMFENKRGTQEKSKRKALEFYELSRSHPIGNFNATRLESLCYEDAPIQYAVSVLYAEGQGVEIEPNLAFFWCLKSAYQKYKKAIITAGEYYKGGFGVSRDNKEAVKWFEKVPDNPQACIHLGNMYYYGEGVSQDLAKSFFYRQRAAEQGDINAHKDVAWMYERGEGTPQDYQQALQHCILVANSSGKVSAIYGAARMFEILGQHPQALEWYQKVLTKTEQRSQASDSHGGMDHSGALYRLGRLFEKGKGTGIDQAKAKDLYTKAAKVGHLPARIKLRLMERSDDSYLASFEDLEGLTPEVQLHYVQESQRLLDALNQDHQITARGLLGIRLMENGDIGFQVLGDRVLHNIREDYNAARAALKAVEQQHKDDPVQVNYEFITVDPYLKYYFTDVNEAIPDEDITNVKFTALLQEINRASRNQPAYTEDVRNHLKSINDKFLLEGESQYLLRKRLVRQYQKWTQEDSDQAIEVQGATPEDRLQQRQGIAAIRFSQAGAVCLDGLSQYLEELENNEIYSFSEGTPLGVRLSKVLNQYKEDLLKKHKNTAHGAHEEAVEAMRLLKERMRLPLGLPGTFSPMLYPTLGQGDDDVYSPEKVMERFLRGGNIPNRANINPISAYTPQLMIQLLKDAVNGDRKSHLKREHLNLFIQRHAVLKPLFLDAFMNFEENEYFNPNTDSKHIYKDALFEKILQIHGYILKK